MELIRAVTSVPCPATVLPGIREENPLNITSTFSSHTKESLALLMPSGRFSYPLTLPVDEFIQHTLLTDKLSSLCSSLLTGTAISLLAAVNSAPLWSTVIFSTKMLSGIKGLSQKHQFSVVLRPACLRCPIFFCRGFLVFRSSYLFWSTG